MMSAAEQAAAGSGKKKKRKRGKKQRAGLPADVKKFSRGGDFPTKRIADQKLRTQMGRQEYLAQEAAVHAARSEILQPHDAGHLEADGMERTFKFTQEKIAEAVDATSARKIYDLSLQQGPYHCRYARNGRHLLIGGQKGHVAQIDWHSGKVKAEIQLRETVRDVCFLHNESLFAVAQKKYVYVYDQKGIEIHCLRHHRDAHRLEFLPYHMLLSSVGGAGWLKYQDVSTGDLVAELRTGKGRCSCLRQNPTNAVLHCGHGNGTVTLWSPTVQTPLVSLLAHRGPVLNMAIDTGGHYMVSTGLDGYAKCWDLRMFRMLHAYTTLRPAQGLDISQTGLLAVGHGSHVQVWKDALQSKQKSPYLNHEMPGKQCADLRFCPFEDVLGCGHSDGFSSVVVPGAGFANYDSFEANPFQTKKQRQEAEVRSLLEKLKPDQITLDANFIGTVHDHEQTVQAARDQGRARRTSAGGDQAPKAVEEGEEDGGMPAAAEKPRMKEKHRQRGRSTAMKRWLRKSSNVVDAGRLKAKENAEEAAKEEAKAKARGPTGKRTALDRFA